MNGTIAHRHACAAALFVALTGAPAAWAQGSGDAAQAVQQLTRTIKSDSLSGGEIAKAFYRRGLAYRELGQHAHAIADFSSALWLQGLSAQEQTKAHEERSAAYRALGMSAPAQAEGARAGAAPARTAASAAPQRPAAGAFETRVETGARAAPRQARPQAAFNPFDTPHFDAEAPPAAPPRSAPRTTAAPAPSAPQPLPAFRTSVLPVERARRAAPPQEPRAAAAPARTASAEPAQRPRDAQPAAAEPAQPRTGSRIGRFFGGLLAPSGQSEAQPAEAAGSWGASTTVSPSGGGQRTAAPATVAAARADAAPPPAATSGRSYRLQLASVRSEGEARDAWASLSARHQELIGDREPMIERSDLGELGTFYRVQLGPFADRREPLQLCNAFKRGGVDCFLIAQ